MIQLQPWECFCKLNCLLTQLLQPGKIVVMFLRFSLQLWECFYKLGFLLHNHHNQAKLWECFHDFVAAMGMFLKVALFAYTTTTTRQNCGNVSTISLQLWECFYKLCHFAYTTTTTRQNCGNISVHCIVCISCHQNYGTTVFPLFCCGY